MLEEAVIPSIWASIISWFTPTVLFILLNIVIGTIAVTSGFGNQKSQQKQQIREEEDHHHHQQQEQRFHHQLVRAPSNVIQRLKSINLYHFKTEDLNPFSSFSSHDHHPHENRVETQDHHQPSVIQRLKSINLYSFKAEDLNPFHQEPYKLDEAHAHQQQQQQQLPQSRLARAPSNVIQRLKSINLSDLNPFQSFQQQPPPSEVNHHIQKTKTPIRKLQKAAEISPQYPHDDEFDISDHHHHQEVRRSNSDRRPAKLVSQKDKMIKKSMSAKLDFWDFGNKEEEEEEETEKVHRRKHSTVIKETTATIKAKAKASESERFGDHEVDAKADDFINKFKHQLKLQRLDSIMRNKDDRLGKDGKINMNL